MSARCAAPRGGAGDDGHRAAARCICRIARLACAARRCDSLMGWTPERARASVRRSPPGDALETSPRADSYRDPDPARLEQRDRRQLERFVARRAARYAQVESAPQPPQRSSARRGRAAQPLPARAHDPVGDQGPSTATTTAPWRRPRPPEARRGSPGGLLKRDPACGWCVRHRQVRFIRVNHRQLETFGSVAPIGAAGVTPSTSRSGRSGACSSRACLIATSSVARERRTRRSSPSIPVSPPRPRSPAVRRCRRGIPCRAARCRAPRAPAARAGRGRGRGSAAGWPRRRPARARPGGSPAPRASPITSMMRRNPSPYMATTAATRACASSRASPSSSASTRAESCSTASSSSAGDTSALMPARWACESPCARGPSPVYMWTPHGRHGSKLRTARMMSTPLKLSGPFSSNMGVFCTASSYGPGVP